MSFTRNVLGATPAASPEAFEPINIDHLPIGAQLQIPIFDARDVLLLARGATITPTFLQKLKLRRIDVVKVHAAELPRLYAGQPLGTARATLPYRPGRIAPHRNPASDELDRVILRGHLRLPAQQDAFLREMVRHGPEQYDAGQRSEFIEHRERALADVDEIHAGLAEGDGVDPGRMGAIVDEALVQLASDSDLFNCLFANPHSAHYPRRHSLHTAMLALSIGAHLGLDRPSLLDLTIGCLIHDAGMLKIDSELFSRPRIISPTEFIEVTKHPVIVFEMFREKHAISNNAALVAYQMHERCNGSGYPRRRDAGQIHELAKIAAVADAYLGLCSPRPHRPGMLPYLAVETILRGTKDGLFDAAVVRGLLKTMSLFPVGSFVQMKDGRVGRVLRANGEVYHRPVVEAWQPHRLNEPAEIINLQDSAATQIAKPLAGLPNGDSQDEPLDM